MEQSNPDNTHHHDAAPTYVRGTTYTAKHQATNNHVDISTNLRHYKPLDHGNAHRPDVIHNIKDWNNIDQTLHRIPCEKERKAEDTKNVQ